MAFLDELKEACKANSDHGETRRPRMLEKQPSTLRMQRSSTGIDVMAMEAIKWEQEEAASAEVDELNDAATTRHRYRSYLVRFVGSKPPSMQHISENQVDACIDEALETLGEFVD